MVDTSRHWQLQTILRQMAFYGGQSNLADFYKFIPHNHNFHHQNQLQVGSVLQCPPFLPSIYNYRIYRALWACFTLTLLLMLWTTIICQFCYFGKVTKFWKWWCIFNEDFLQYPSHSSTQWVCSAEGPNYGLLHTSARYQRSLAASSPCCHISHTSYHIATRR